LAAGLARAAVAGGALAGLAGWAGLAGGAGGLAPFETFETVFDAMGFAVGLALDGAAAGAGLAICLLERRTGCLAGSAGTSRGSAIIASGVAAGSAGGRTGSGSLGRAVITGRSSREVKTLGAEGPPVM
jgi:hypothetical protein